MKNKLLYTIPKNTVTQDLFVKQKVSDASLRSNNDEVKWPCNNDGKCKKTKLYKISKDQVVSGYEKFMRKYINLDEQSCMDSCTFDSQCLAGVSDSATNTCWKYVSYVTSLGNALSAKKGSTFFLKIYSE